MSYDLRLQKNDETVELSETHHLKGGTYAMGGTTRADFNVTYNYATLLRKAFHSDKGLRTLYGLTATESLSVLATAMQELDAADTDPDYWKPTEGNVWNALRSLLQLAVMAVSEGHGDAVWDGD